ncbi:MAG: redox-regulated ATPase YchF, partial [Verrucomicrobia bacterium]|nr:redox-regulated ATPase YchF [Verrucomicrobiota bacterium]
DIQSAEQQLDRNQKKVRSQDKDAIANVELLARLVKHLNENLPASSLEVSDDERTRLRSYNLLSFKKVLYACNVAEADLADSSKNPHVANVRAHIAKQHGCESVVICAQVEAELCDLSPAEATEFLQSLGVTDSGVSDLIRGAYKLLGLATYFTAGEKEVRAWTFRHGMTAPQCAAVIHTDFEKGFVKAEIVSYDDLVKNGSVAAARDAGRYRLEGKSYLFKDGDVALFRFTD